LWHLSLSSAFRPLTRTPGLPHPLSAVLYLGSDLFPRYIMVPSSMSVWSSCSLLRSRERNTWKGYMKEFKVRMDKQTAREQSTKKTTLHNSISSTLVVWSSTVSAPDSSRWSPFVSPRNSSPDHFSAIELVLSFRCQINGFSTLNRDVVMCEPGSGGHCMILVTRYLLVGRVESEVNNDLIPSFLGSDSISGLYKSKWRPSVRFQAVTRPM